MAPQLQAKFEGAQAKHNLEREELILHKFENYNSLKARLSELRL